MDFRKIDILELLPQRPPFVMIDTLEYCDRETTITNFKTQSQNIFCNDGMLSESGVIENIAQSCAARMGYINKYINKENIHLGFIGAIRNLEIFRLPKAGEQLRTEIKVLEEIFHMTLVKATVSSQDEVISSCEMKISISEIENAG